MELNQFSLSRDHPRSRGKDCPKPIYLHKWSGSPPLAREGLLIQMIKKGPGGITPARAGRTSIFLSHTRPFQDHPRSRGKDYIYRENTSKKLGSPPHVREGLDRIT